MNINLYFIDQKNNLYLTPELKLCKCVSYESTNKKTIAQKTQTID